MDTNERPQLLIVTGDNIDIDATAKYLLMVEQMHQEARSILEAANRRRRLQ